MSLSKDKAVYEGVGRSPLHNKEAPAYHIKIEGLDLPEGFLNSVFQALSDFLSRLLDSLRIDLRPCADDAALGAENFIAIFSIDSFTFRFNGAPALPAGQINWDIKHKYSPSSDVEQHSADSHSTGRNESLTRENAETAAHTVHSRPVAPVDRPLADLLKTLPLDELRSLQKRIVPEALISDLCGQASEELLRRKQK